MEGREVMITSPLQGCWILVAEDDGLISLDLQLTIEAAGAHVVPAFSLAQAFAVLDRHRWAGAVLDYALCDGDCTPLCELLIERRVPFIICSGYDAVSDPCSRGVQIKKPATANEVVETLVALVA